MSSGFSYPQPIFQSPVYNPAFYLTLDATGYLTYDYAQTLYLGKNDYRLTYITGITQGTATQGIALVPGTNNDISGLGAISCSSLTVEGSAVTATQTNITSVGTLSGLTIAGNLVFSSASRTITGLSSIAATTLTGALSTASQTNITAVASKALVVDANKDIGSIRNLDAQNLNGSIKVSGTLGDFGSIKISGTDIITSSRHIQNVGNIACSGTMNPSAGIQINTVNFVDATRNISATSLSTSGDITCGGALNGFLAYGDQSNITSVGSLTELGIRSTPTDEFFSIIGNGTDYLDGSYTRMCSFSGSNLTPVKFQIEVHNGTSATATNATWIGNYTNNDLRFGINNSISMILTTTGRLGVGTSSPSAPLHIVGTNTYVFGAGGTTVYRLRTDNGATESALGPISYNVAGIFGGYIACAAMAMTSDRRLKRNIQSCPIDRVKRLYDSCEVKLYESNESENRQGQEVGLIAQDLVSAHLTDLISVFYRDDIQEGDDPTLEPAKTQLNVDYSRISAYNMKMIQHIMSEIDRLKDRVANIES
ncbi:unnamed protein product [Phytophthora lilii]|uniref:Unnamed protein product n=1 Tax=Phytophthora lilii TaxID=2077276 RepID=A0A9W6WM01_9STRA|nr:unnamed protein product [Phytophthora lilii]